MKRSLYIIITVVLLMPFVNASAQSVRTEAMGGVTYAVSDSVHTLGLYHFAGNPAFIMHDEKYSSLLLLPSAGSVKGSYRRSLEAENTSMYSASARDIVQLGEWGVFMGYASYDYEKRNDVNRGLRLNNYSGDAFFLMDSLSGNFSYGGTAAGFAYGFEPAENLSFGIGADYKITDGLKDRYSFTEGLTRYINAYAGAGYKFSDNFMAGAFFRLFDSQETIELTNLAGPTAEIMNYFGEKFYNVTDRSVISEKIRQKGAGGSVHFTYMPENSFQMSVSSGFQKYNSSLLIPKDNEKEFQQGYAYFEKFDVTSEMKYLYSENLQFGLKAAYSSDYSWSKNTPRNLVLWDWTVKSLLLGSGASYFVKSANLLLAAEIEVRPLNADSIKYIDGRNYSASALNNALRIGAEYRAGENTFIRFGLSHVFDDLDLEGGRGAVRNNIWSIGLGKNFPGFADINAAFIYNSVNPSGISLFREKYRLSISVRPFN